MNRLRMVFEKYKKTSVPVKASLWYTICNILQKGISFIVIPIYTRVLSTTEYGEYSVFQSWLNILIIFATLNLYCGVFTKAMVEYDDDRDRYTSCMQALSTMLTVGLFLIYLIRIEFWNSLFRMETMTMILMFLYFVFYPAIMFWSVRQRVEYKYKSMVIVTLLVSVAIPIISLLLLFYTDLRSKAVIWGYLLVQGVAGSIFYGYNFIKGKIFYEKKYWIHALKFNIPLIPHYLSLIVLGQADRIMIGKYCGTGKTAIYNLAYQVSMLMNIFIVAINNSLVPWTYARLKEKEYKSIKKTSNSLCIMNAVMTIGAILIAPEIIRILGTEEYIDAIWVIPMVTISVYFTFVYSLFSNVEFYFGQTKYVMVASVVGAILNIILNAMFIPKYGFIAAGYTTLFCYFTFMVMHFLFMRKVCSKQIGEELVYDIKFIIVSCLLICAIGVLCMVLYNFTVIRYVVIVLGIVLYVVIRKKLVEIIKSFR